MKQSMRSRLGSMTDRAFVSGRSTSITFGHILRPSSTSSAESVWEDNAQFDGCDRRPDKLFQRLRCSNLHTAQTMVRSLALKAVRQSYETTAFSHSIRTNRSRILHFNIGIDCCTKIQINQTLGLAIALVQCWHCPTSTYTGGIALLLSLPLYCVVAT